MTRQRMVTVVLILSLAINLLFVGALIGRWVLGPRPADFPRHFGWIMRGLDEETRNDLRPILRRQAEQLIPLRREMQAAQLRFDHALTSEPLDEEALDSALTDLRNTTVAFQAAMHEQMVTIIKRMSPQERQRMARYLQSRGPGNRHRPRGPRDGPRP